MIHTLHNCIIFTKDPSLIGILIMNGHQIHYTYDISHLIQYISISDPDAIIIDCCENSVIQEHLDVALWAKCRVIVRGDDITLPAGEHPNISIFPASMSDADLVQKIGNLSNPETREIIQNKNILIVEDNDDLREMYVIGFRSKGYQIHEANDGLAGIAKAAEVKPGIIILDIMMPHMDGFEVLHTLKNNTSIRPIILVNSNLEWVDEEKKVRELGADYFLRKSQYTPLEVVDFIEKNIYRTL